MTFKTLNSFFHIEDDGGKGGREVRQMLTLADKGGGGSGY